MFPLSITVVFLIVAALFAQLTAQRTSRLEAFREASRYVDAVLIAKAVDRFVAQRGAFPASLDALVATPGYEALRSARNNWQGFALSATLTDGAWSYQRMALWTRDPSRGVDAATYAAINRCGSGSVFTAASWCGDQRGHWFRRETRALFPYQLAEQRIRQHRTLQVFADAYSAAGSFPDQDADGNSLVAGSIESLASLAGYSAGAAACTGVYLFDGVPLDCADLFNQWGQPVGYQFISSSSVLLVSEPPIFDASGARVVIATAFTIP